MAQSLPGTEGETQLTKQRHSNQSQLDPGYNQRKKGDV